MDEYVWGRGKNMKVRKRVSLLMGVVLLSLALVLLEGCGTLETLVNKDGTATTLGDFIGGNSSGTLPDATSTTTSGDGITITLYFSDATGKYLIKEQRLVPKTVSLARETVNEWLKGPAVVNGTTELASVPTTTKLLDIGLKDSVVIVDLSKEFLQPNAKVSAEVALYGLVNTLTQFSTIKQVQIRVEGQTLTKYGTVNATNLVNKASLVKEAVSANPINPSSTTTPTSSPSSINIFDYSPSTT